MNDWGQHIVSNLFVASGIGCLAWFVGRSGRQASLAHLLWVSFFVKLITPPIVWISIDVPPGWLSAMDKLAISPHVAIVLDSADFGWVAVEWSGVIRCVKNEALITIIPKHQVSALAFSQEVALDLSNLVP